MDSLVSSILSGGFIGSTEPVERSNVMPRINYYRNGNQDIFAVRGTDDNEDLAIDAVIGIQDLFGNLIQHPTILEKEKQLVKYIKKNHRKGSELVLVGHSLGSLHINNIMNKFKKPRVIGFGHPMLPPNPKAEAMYSYDLDPLFRPSGKRNHIVLKKRSQSLLPNPFAEFHSTNNFYE